MTRGLKTVGYLASLGLAVAIWDGLIRCGLANADLLPGPGAVFKSLVEQATTAEFRADLWETLFRSVLGLVIGAAVAVPLGVVMALSPAARGFFEPLVKASYSLPKISLIPLLILWFGIGTTTNVIAVVLSTLLPVLVYTYHGVESVPKVLLWSANAMGTGPREMVWRVRIPAALPSILIGIRVGLGLSFVIAIAAEMIASNRGIGKLIFVYGESGAYAPMFAAVTAVVIAAATIDIAFLRMSDYVLRWSDSHAVKR